MKEELISIIVAVYNTEKYIEQCIQSVINQTYTYWELIIVDDGSTDKSGRICDDYSKKDTRIKVFHQSNGGQSKARNKALKHCQGEYYIFLDSDDKLSQNALKKLYISLMENSADIVCAGIKAFGSKSEKYMYLSETTECISSKEACRRMFIQDGLDSNTVAKIYKSVLWNDVRFPEGTIFEDVPIMYKLILKCNKVVLEDFCVYEQRSRADSTTRSHFSEKRKIYTYYSKGVYEDILKHYPDLKEEAFVYYLTSVIDNYIHICCSPYKEEFSGYKKELLAIINSNKDLINKYFCLSKMKLRIWVCKMGIGNILYPIYQKMR